MADGPLQPIYEEVLKGLVAVGKGKCENADQRVLDVAKYLAPVRALVQQSWKRLIEERFEIKLLDVDATTALSEADLDKVEPPNVLAWLAVQAIADASCDKSRTFDAAAWALDVMHFATSREAVYQGAFQAFGNPWPRTANPNPWSRKAALLAGVMHEIAAQRQDAKPLQFKGVSVYAGPGPAAFSNVATGTDVGQGSTGNQAVDLGEVVAFSLSFHGGNSNPWLVSESAVPGNIPPCMVVPWRRLVLPEVAAGNSGSLDVPAVLISDRCKGGAKLELTVSSSAASGASMVTIDASFSSETLIARDFFIDADAFGHSVAGDPANGVVPGQNLEIVPVVLAPAGLSVRLASASAAVDSDAPLLGLAPFAEFPLQRNGSGDARGADDLDLSPARSGSFSDVLAQRSASNPLTVNGDRVWIKLAYVAAPQATFAAKADVAKPPIKRGAAKADKAAPAEPLGMSEQRYVRYVPLKVSPKAAQRR